MYPLRDYIGASFPHPLLRTRGIRKHQGRAPALFTMRLTRPLPPYRKLGCNTVEAEGFIVQGTKLAWPGR